MPKPFRITRMDAGLDAIVAPNAKLELIAGGFGLSEGPLWVREGRSGYLLVSGLIDNVIYKVSADKQVSVFLEKAGYTGTDIEHVGAQTRSGRSLRARVVMELRAIVCRDRSNRPGLAVTDPV